MGLKYYQMNPHELVPRASAALRWPVELVPTKVVQSISESFLGVLALIKCYYNKNN